MLLEEQLKKLNIGSSRNTVEGWINLDGSWNARLAKHPTLRRVLKSLGVVPSNLLDTSWNTDILVHDVKRPLPFSENSIACIYASHLLEHLYLEDAKRLLKECYRVLQPGGILRVVVPDLQAIVLEYMGEQAIDDAYSDPEISRADRMNKRLSFREPAAVSGNTLFRIYAALKDFHTHKWMYDAESLVMYFRGAGFVSASEMNFLQSQIEGIEAIEKAERVINGAGVCVEGVKSERQNRLEDEKANLKCIEVIRAKR